MELEGIKWNKPGIERQIPHFPSYLEAKVIAESGYQLLGKKQG